MAALHASVKPGDTVLGGDGTAYLVVRISTVRDDQMRWWIDKREVRMHVRDYVGPDTPEDLHLIPACDCGSIGYALVLP